MERGIYEMDRGYDLNQALREAGRCLLCYDPPCSKECPAGTDPGTFIRKLRFKNIKGAVRTIKNNNIFGGVCGVVCPVEKLCQKGCLQEKLDRPIEIGKIQRFLVEWGWTTNFNPLEKDEFIGVRVGVIGSGPAGLTFAAEVAKAGFEVTVFEAKDEPGGVLRYGIPDFRLSREFLEREIQDIVNLGVKIRCNSRVGENGVDELLNNGFQAVFIATGTWRPSILSIPGSDLQGVTTSIDFLEKIRRGGIDDAKKLVSNRNVGIIGGGSVAMNVAVTCKKLGARRVYCICLEGLSEIPAVRSDLYEAIENFVVIKPHCQVKEIYGTNGRVSGLRGSETEWLLPDDFSPSNAREVEGTDFELKVQAVIMAIGSSPEDGTKGLSQRIRFKDNGIVITEEDGVSTSDSRIFAGGDVVRGPSLVVNAVADGKRAAQKVINLFKKGG